MGRSIANKRAFHRKQEGNRQRQIVSSQQSVVREPTRPLSLSPLSDREAPQRKPHKGSAIWQLLVPAHPETAASSH